jgi:hypothetical protein
MPPLVGRHRRVRPATIGRSVVGRFRSPHGFAGGDCEGTERVEPFVVPMVGLFGGDASCHRGGDLAEMSARDGTHHLRRVTDDASHLALGCSGAGALIGRFRQRYRFMDASRKRPKGNGEIGGGGASHSVSVRPAKARLSTVLAGKRHRKRSGTDFAPYWQAKEQHQLATAR